MLDNKTNKIILLLIVVAIALALIIPTINNKREDVSFFEAEIDSLQSLNDSINVLLHLSEYKVLKLQNERVRISEEIDELNLKSNEETSAIVYFSNESLFEFFAKRNIETDSL